MSKTPPKNLVKNFGVQREARKEAIREAEQKIGKPRMEQIRKNFNDLILDRTTVRQELLQHLQTIGYAPLTSDYVKNLENSIIGRKTNRFKYIQELIGSLNNPAKAINEWCGYIFFKEGSESPLESLMNERVLFNEVQEQNARNEFIKNLRVETLRFICEKLGCDINELRAVIMRDFTQFNLTENAVDQYNEYGKSQVKSKLQQSLDGEVTEDMWKEFENFTSKEKLACQSAMTRELKDDGFLFLKGFENGLFPSIKYFLDSQFFGKKSSSMETILRAGKSTPTNSKETAVLNMRAAVLDYLSDKFKCKPEDIQTAYNRAGDGVIGDDVVAACKTRAEKRQAGKLGSDEEHKTPPHSPKTARGSVAKSPTTPSPATPTSPRNRGSSTSASPLSTRGNNGKSSSNGGSSK